MGEPYRTKLFFFNEDNDIISCTSLPQCINFYVCVEYFLYGCMLLKYGVI